MFPGDNSTVIVNATMTSSDTRTGLISQAIYTAIGLGTFSRFRISGRFHKPNVLCLEYREAMWVEQQAARSERSISNQDESNTVTPKEREQLQHLKGVSLNTRANVIHQLTTRLAKSRRKIDNTGT